MKLKPFLFALLAQLFSLTAMAYDAEIDGIYYDFSGTQATVVSGDNRYSGSITIPSSVSYNGKTYEVTSIGNEAFSGCWSLYSITIPESVTSIGNGVFTNCSNLSSITIPENLTRIGDEAFRYCGRLNSIVVEEGNSVYDSRNGCNALIETATNTLLKGCKNTIIPEDIICIGSNAFSACRGLTTITIPMSVTTIGNSAFNACYDLASITISENITSIGLDAFNECNLASIVVEEGNTVYDSRNNCNALIETTTNTLILGCKNTVIPEGVTNIGNNAFWRCGDLPSITIPESVTAIGVRAFEGCRGLTSITIPESVTTIGASAFQSCEALTSVNISNGVTSIGAYAFYGTPWYENQPEGLIYAGKVAYTYKGTMPENTSINLQEGTLGIAEEAFSNCRGLISISFPESVTNIGSSAFYGCNSLEIIDIPEGVTEIGYSTFSGCSSLTSVTIPESVTSIGYGAFSGCNGLTTFNIPEGVTSIGGTAFWYCRNLTSVAIPQSMTSIDDYAFAFTSLKTITIPENVISIGDNSFYACGSLSSVRIKSKTPVTIKEHTFSNNSNATLYVPVNCTEAYQSADYWKDFREIIECDYVNVPEQMIAVGGSTIMEIGVNNFDTDIVAFQMDLTLPEGVSIDKTGCSLSSRITDEEQELTIGKLENGAYRLTSSSLSLTPISGNDGTLITLKLTATEDSDDGQATISNIRFSTADSKRIEMDDVSFNIDIVQKYKLTYIVDGEVYKTYDVLETTQLTLEEEPIKEGYTFSGWSELPEIMPAHEVEVTGSFSVNSYTLTYIVDGEVYKTDTVEYGTTLSAEDPTKEGYTFGGWSEIPETMPAQDVVVTGSFTINSYNLTYIVDGEVFKTSSVVYGTELTPEAEPTKDGYTFGGWSELAETMPAYDVEVTGRFYLYGDVNTDEEVDVVDVVDIARFVVATPSVKFREKLADLNYDNSVNIGDAVTLVNYIAGDQNFVKEMFAPEQNTVSDALSLTKNGKTVALNLTNGRAYTAFQFDLYVPEDANIAKMMLNSQRKQKHQLLYNKVEDGHYRVAALSISNDTFQGTEGELLSFVMEEEINVEVEISDIHFFDTRGNDYTLDVIGIGQETGVNSLQESGTSGAIYDLQGRKLSKMQRGVNIVDGKKYIMK